MEIKVSVILPVYSSEKHFRKSLESILGQTLRETEIICTSCGPAEGKLEIAQELAEKDPRIQIIQENAGTMGEIFNRCVKEAQGKYICFLSPDDFFEENLLENAVQKAEEEKAQIVVWDTDTFSAQTGEYAKTEETIHKAAVPAYLPVDHFALAGNPFTVFSEKTWDKLFLTEFVREQGLAFKAINAYSGLAFTLGGIVTASQISVVDEILAHRFEGAGTYGFPAENEGDFYQALAALKVFLNNHELWGILSREFKNYALHVCLKTLEKASGKERGILYNRLKDEWFQKIGLLKKSENYFYDKQEYAKLKAIEEGRLSEYDLGISVQKALLESRAGDAEDAVAAEIRDLLVKLEEKKRAAGDEAEPVIPKVSIVMPVYNSEEDMGNCLRSCLSQTLKEIEVICVDDGSTDRSWQLLELYHELDPRVIAVSQKNQGAGPARNNALGRAHGEFVFFMDSDDFFPGDTVLERLYTTAKEQNVQIVGGSRLIWTKDGIIPKEQQTFTKEELVEYKDFQYDYDYQCYLFDLDMLRENNIFFPPYRRYQDPPFFARAMITAERFFTIPDPTYVYRRVPSHVKWTNEKVTDLVRGIADCMGQAKEHRLGRLYYNNLMRLEEDFRRNIADHCDRKTIRFLLELEKDLDLELLNEGAGCEAFEEGYELQVLNAVFNKNADKVKKLNREKAEINAKLQKTYDEKFERGVRIRELEDQLRWAKKSGLLKVSNGMAKVYGTAKRTIKKVKK